MAESPYPITDIELARRLEGTEAAANVAFIEARARLDPGVGAAHTRVAGVSAMFDGPGSPLTQTFGPVMVRADGVHCFLAEIEGHPVATGAMGLAGDVALLAGTSTIPSARRRGAQLALLAARLEYASSRGADLAMMVAPPGGASQRNAERQGFRTAYTRTKWRLRSRGA